MKSFTTVAFGDLFCEKKANASFPPELMMKIDFESKKSALFGLSLDKICDLSVAKSSICLLIVIVDPCRKQKRFS